MIRAYGPVALYEVGDGKPFATIGAVPWESLQADDSVLTYWQPAAYKEKRVADADVDLQDYSELEVLLQME